MARPAICRGQRSPMSNGHTWAAGRARKSCCSNNFSMLWWNCVRATLAARNWLAVQPCAWSNSHTASGLMRGRLAACRKKGAMREATSTRRQTSQASHTRAGGMPSRAGATAQPRPSSRCRPCVQASRMPGSMAR